MPRFATVVNCMDGRTQLAVIRHVQRRTGARFVDSITEAGPDGILARSGTSAAARAIRRRLGVSEKAHGSRTCYVVAHHDCAGNPVSRAQHLKHVARAVARVRKWAPGMTVIPLWVDGKWKVHELRDGKVA